MPRRIDKGRCDSLFAKSFGGLQPVQTLNKHEARAGRYNGDHQSRDEELIFDADNFCCHLSMLAGQVLRRLLEFSAALLFDDPNCGRISKSVPGDYAMTVGHDDCACLSEAPIRIFLPSLTRNFVEIIGPHLDVIGLGVHDTN